MACRLVVQIGDRTLRFPLGPGDHLLGSGPDCAVVVRHPTVSRRHATVTVADDRVTLSDLGSRNGTRVDGHSLTLRRREGGRSPASRTPRPWITGAS